MLSGKLIHLIEAHQEHIAANVIREIRHHPEMPHFQKLSDAELRERGQQILENLGHWVAAGHEAEIGQQYESLGRARFEESIPLHESVRALAILKDKMIDFVHEQGVARAAVRAFLRYFNNPHGARLRDRMAPGRARCCLNAAYFFSVRMYAMTSAACGSVTGCGFILPVPLRISFFKSGSDWACTSAEPSARIFMAAIPEPSGLWQPLHFAS
jgi:hypothetical protein